MNDMETERESGLRSPWWALYFGFLLLLDMAGYALIFRMPAAGWPEFLMLFFTVGAYFGYGGFLLKRPLMTPAFWRGYLLALLVYMLAYYWLTDIDLRRDASYGEFIITQSVGFAVYLPGFFALFQYGDKSDAAWHRNRQA